MSREMGAGKDSNLYASRSAGQYILVSTDLYGSGFTVLMMVGRVLVIKWRSAGDSKLLKASGGVPGDLVEKEIGVGRESHLYGSKAVDLIKVDKEMSRDLLGIANHSSLYQIYFFFN